ncbi:hypothetical protein ACWDSL_06725 [Streptomyces sp. NPDC000941]
MPTAAITAEDLIRRYADDIAYAAATTPATDLDTLANQAGTAARNFSMARINGHEDVETAASYLHEAHLATDATEHNVFLRKADKLLSPLVWDMSQEYRDMVGD